MLARNGRHFPCRKPRLVHALRWPPFESPVFPLPMTNKIRLLEAIELGLIHGREYQEQLENMCLAALSLTLNRYRFDVRPLVFS